MVRKTKVNGMGINEIMKRVCWKASLLLKSYMIKT